MLLAAVAASLSIVVYANALDNPFVYDDRDTVVANPSLVDVGNVRFVLTHSPFRPAVNVSYAIDRAVWGPAPFGFHLTNVVLHAVVVVLLFVWLLRVIEDGGIAVSPAAHAFGAFAGAALFAVHPSMTEAVGYVSGRSEVLCAAWFLMAVLLGRRAILSGSRPSAAASLLCGAAAVASKETAAALPVVLLAYDWLVRPSDDARRRRRLWLVFVPILAVLAAAAIYRVAFLQPPAGAGRSPILNLWTQAIVIWRYVGLLGWPGGQTIMHDAQQVSTLADPAAILGLAALVAAAAAACLARRRQPLLALGIVWFLSVMAPSSSVIPLREVMAEHRVYLAGAGLFLVLAVAAARLSGSLQRGRRRLPAAVPVFLVGVVALLSLLTVQRNRVWASPVSLWAEAAQRSPAMWEPHYALGDALREAGDCGAAIHAYEVVVKMRPGHRDAYTNLGICLAQTGRLEEAETAFRLVLQIDPAFVRGYTNLGALALVAGDPERARDFYREAIVQDPRNVLARMQLARLYEGTFHDYHSAARMCGEARAIAPATPGVVECVERNQKLAAAKDAGR